MFLQNLVKLNSSYFSTEFRPQIQVKTKKKVFAALWFYLSPDFLLPSRYYLPENQGGQIYFALFSVRPKGGCSLATLPKSTPMLQSIAFRAAFVYSSSSEPCVRVRV